jgi:hypothetical protein
VGLTARTLISLAMAAVIVAGCGGSSGPRTSAPAASLGSALATYEDAGFAFDYPASWTLRPTAPIDDPSGATREAVIGTLPYAPHCGSDALEVGCVLSQPMTPDSVEVLIGTAVLHGATIDDYAKPRTGTAVHTTVAGRPAIFYDRGMVPNNAVGSDLDLEWQVAQPGTLTETLVITARIRGPNVDGQRAEVQALVDSLRVIDGQSPGAS